MTRGFAGEEGGQGAVRTVAGDGGACRRSEQREAHDGWDRRREAACRPDRERRNDDKVFLARVVPVRTVNLGL